MKEVVLVRNDIMVSTQTVEELEREWRRYCRF